MVPDGVDRIKPPSLVDYADSDEEDPHEGGTGPHPINMVQAMTLRLMMS